MQNVSGLSNAMGHVQRGIAHRVWEGRWGDAVVVR